MGQATEIYAKEFEARFHALPHQLRLRIIEAVRSMGTRLDTFSHQRLQGRPEFKLRVGDYRIIYRFDIAKNEISLVTLGHRRDIYR